MEKYSFKSDCLYFRGDIPCRPHKETGIHCTDCNEFTQVKNRVLIIKLGAIGDVIRTTPLISRIRKDIDGAEIWWLTLTPEVVPAVVDKILNYDLKSLNVLRATEFDVLINLDKDDYACAIAAELKAEKRFGFTWKNGRPAPVNELAKHKFITGLYDDANKANSKSYPVEIFEICGWEFGGEEYIIDVKKEVNPEIISNGKIIVGLNTGCGARWVSRLWSKENWTLLIRSLQNSGYFPMLLGGRQEDERNKELAHLTGAFYPGHFSLQEFISLMDHCDVIVTGVTMGLHIATALKKKVVLMNNIFNSKEFELYGRGIIVEPDKECTCFFLPECKNEEYFCMDHLPPDKIFAAVEQLSH